MSKGEVTGNGFATQKSEREGRVGMIVVQVFLEVREVVVVLTVIIARRIIITTLIDRNRLRNRRDRDSAEPSENIRSILGDKEDLVL